MHKLLIFSFLVIVLATMSCQKNDIPPVETPIIVVNRDSIDNKLITDFLTKKNWTAQKTPEGVFYIIDTQGVDTTKMPTVNNNVTIKYKGYLLTEAVFDQSQTGFTALLSNLIKGFQIGVPKFAKGGKGKLLIPSALAYGSSGAGAAIPPNTPLVFEIELVDFK